MKIVCQPTDLICSYGPMPGYRVWRGVDEQGNRFNLFVLAACAHTKKGRDRIDALEDESLPADGMDWEANCGFQEMTLYRLANGLANTPAGGCHINVDVNPAPGSAPSQGGGKGAGPEAG